METGITETEIRCRTIGDLMKKKSGNGGWIWLLSVCLLLNTAAALEPYDIALLVNERSPDSLMLANEYAAMRGIPDKHIIYLELPDSAVKPPYTITERQFEQLIRAPVLEALEERGIAEHVYAWIYSTDFPIRVRLPEMPLLSLQGMTLLGRHRPTEQEVTRGLYRSPYYAGPVPELGEDFSASRTFDTMISDPAAAEAVPSMMLSFTRSRGLNMEESLAVLRRGIAADSSAPHGDIYFVKTSDEHRSNPRHWQFEPVSEWLNAQRVRTMVVEAYPERAENIMGMLTGAITVKPEEYGIFAPGSVAGHMTSWAAAFDRSQQTKLTAWLRSGVTASSGTIDEPHAIWTKFPTAFLFLHYRSGCSIIESFFQAVRCPLQLLIVGEPLARPWVRKPLTTIVSLDDDPLRGRALFFTRLMPDPPQGSGLRYRYRLNDAGRNDLSGADISLETTELDDGYHTLRVIVDSGRDVNIRSSAETGFIVNNRGRTVTMSAAGNVEQVVVDQPIALSVEAQGGAVEVGVRSRSFMLATAEGSEAVLQVELDSLGAGPVPLQPFARYEGGETVYGKPLRIRLQPSEVTEEEQPGTGGRDREAK